LYLLALTQIKIFAFVTPVGGVALLVGWLFAFIFAMKLN